MSNGLRTAPLARMLVVALAAAAAACTGDGDAKPDDGWTPDPVPEPGDVKLSVAAAETNVPLGEDIVFRVKVSNTGKVLARVNQPRISTESLQFRVRSESFDSAWVTRIPYREGAGPDPETVAEIQPGGTLEAEVRTVAVMSGRLVFSPVYTWQGADQPVTCDAVTVEVAPAGGKSHLGFRMETSHGTMEAKLRPDVAYGTCEAQAALIKKGFFDGLTFHRVIQGFMAQGGDPLGNGQGGPGYRLRLEFDGKLRHRRGVFSMARQSQPVDSAGSQFFVMFAERPDLDRGRYTTFAEMTTGDDALARLESVGASQNSRPGMDAPREKITITKASLVLLP